MRANSSNQFSNSNKLIQIHTDTRYENMKRFIFLPIFWPLTDLHQLKIEILLPSIFSIFMHSLTFYKILYIYQHRLLSLNIVLCAHDVLSVCHLLLIFPLPPLLSSPLPLPLLASLSPLPSPSSAAYTFILHKQARIHYRSKYTTRYFNFIPHSLDQVIHHTHTHAVECTVYNDG